jgi:hypothetical protein
LHNWLIGPGLRKNPHVFQVSRRKALHARELPAEIASELVDDLRTPAMFFLPREDVPANLPVKKDELAVDRDRCFELRRPDPLLQFPQELLIPLENMGRLAL